LNFKGKDVPYFFVIDPDGKRIIGSDFKEVTYSINDDGEIEYSDNIYENDRQTLNALAKTEEGLSQAMFALDTPTEIEFFISDRLLLVQEGNEFVEANGYMLPSENVEVPEFATIVISQANLGVDGSPLRSPDNPKDLEEAVLIIFDTKIDPGHIVSNRKGLVTADMVRPVGKSSNPDIELPHTNSFEGETASFISHELQHLRKSNYNIRQTGGRNEGERDAFESERRFRNQYINK